jgi:esterase FrsA
MSTQTTHATLALAPTFAAYAKVPQAYAGIEGVPPELAVRLPGFASFGIDGERLVEAVRTAGPVMGPATLGWATTLSRYGDVAFGQGEQAEARDDPVAARASFLEASFWYFFARFPHILSPLGAVAYQQHLTAYLRAARYFDPALELVTVHHGSLSLPGYLRLPAGQRVGGWPLVVLWGGIDVWKSDLEIHSQSEALLRRGIATLAVDMPGTGECPVPVTPGAEDILLAAVDTMIADPRIDGAQVGCYGLSFGGHWAVKVALRRPELAGAVQVGGPIHHTFQPEWAGQLPRGTHLALARVLGLDPRGEPALLLARLGELSLVQQGLLPTRRHAPVLSVDGADDELVPIAEFDLLSAQGVQQDRLVFAEDRHVASRNWSLHEAFVTNWFAQQMTHSGRP